MVHPVTPATFARMHSDHSSAATSESVVDHMSELPSGAHFGCTVVCDEPLVCDLLAGMISLRGGLHVVKTHDPANAERFFHKEGRDLLILVLPLRAGDGADVLQQFVTCSPHGSVVLICHEEPPAELHVWLGAQLRAVIRRVDSLRTLQKALDLIVGQWLPQRRSRLTRHFSGKPLTRREMQIFSCIGAGLKNREIAEQLSLSEHTVQAHRKRIAVKLRTRGSELTQRAIAARHGHVLPTG